MAYIHSSTGVASPDVRVVRLMRAAGVGSRSHQVKPSQLFRLFSARSMGPLSSASPAPRSQSSGRTVVVAAVEGHVAGLFGLVDTLRPEAKGVVSELTRMGLEV